MEINKTKYFVEAHLGLGYVEIQNNGSQIRLYNIVEDEDMYVDTKLDSLINFRDALNIVINNIQNN